MIWWFTFSFLIFTRFFGLNWGHPYYFHPDENNIAYALSNLSCSSLFDLKSCFEPGFYAYGQLFLYLAYPVSLVIQNPNLSLRLLSALSSIGSAVVFYKLLKRDFNSKQAGFIGLILFIFTPILIQLAHFGTTESFSIFLFLMALYYRKNGKVLALFVGLLTATKISQLVLFVMLLLNFVFYHKNLKSFFRNILIALLVYLLFSPHYLLNFDLFWQSFNYEASVATGRLGVFYTEQFKNITPFLFELTSVVLPSIGILVLVLAFLGLLLQIKQKRLYLPVLLLLLSLQSLVTYAKWARFLVFIYPLLIYFSVKGLSWLSKRFSQQQWLVIFVLVCQIFFAVIFFRLYLIPDTRLSADKWINANLPSGSKIVTEAANVIDLPISKHNFNVYSVFLYDLDQNPVLSQQTQDLLRNSDYVIVPSRRVFHNYTCFRFFLDKPVWVENCDKSKIYPEINRYYSLLFSNQFKLIKIFKVFNDENFEETLSVFDHPVVRIYQNQN